MNEVTVSVAFVVPPIRGGQQRAKGLEPAMRLQQLKPARNECGQPHGKVPSGLDLTVRATEANLFVDVEERTMSQDTCERCPETSQLVGLMDHYRTVW
jgi:hypothetical protein